MVWTLRLAPVDRLDGTSAATYAPVGWCRHVGEPPFASATVTTDELEEVTVLGEVAALEAVFGVKTAALPEELAERRWPVPIWV
jgi:hypothetical protein